MRLLVAGAGHAALQLAASLRQGGFAGPIILLSDEDGLPYQRPPLSKAWLAGEMSDAALAQRPAAFYASQRIGLETAAVTAIDRAGQAVHTADGRCFAYDHLVLATGARNRALPIPGLGLGGVCALRTLADARGLRERLAAAPRIAIIGAGFIGLEFAAVAAARGLSVAVIEREARVLRRGVSAVMAEHIASVHQGWGVRLLTGTGVRRLLGEAHVAAVETEAGEIVPADLVLVAAGVVPNSELAAEAGLAVADGITVDAQFATADPAISAIGDCASFPGADGPVRLESIQNAVDQARCLADRLCGKPAPYARVPWFWSDQGPLKLQIAGLSAGHDATVLRGDPASGAFSVECLRGGRVIAVESLNRPGDHMAARRMLAG
jgi:3-phenylpropionate/trans-cinnamate dioxygenase ferredoxin reductase component